MHMITINVIDKIGQLLESHQCEEGRTIKSWLYEHVKSYDGEDNAPFVVELNGAQVSHDEILKKGDVVRILLNPSNTAQVIYAIITVASAVYAYQSAQSINNLNQNYENTTEEGRSIYSPQVNNNSAKLNGYVRDIAGQMNVYPDLINAPRRRFEGEPEVTDGDFVYTKGDEFVYFGGSVGQGYYFIPEESIYISESAQNLNSEDFTVNVYDPTDDVSVDAAFDNWITSKEVSSLTLATGGGRKVGNWTFDFLNDTATSKLEGSLIEFPFEVGEVFELENTVESGLYRVLSKSGTSNSVGTLEEVKLSFDNTYIALDSTVTTDSDRQAGLAQANYYLPSGYVFLDDNPTTPTFGTASDVAVDITSVAGAINWEGDFKVLPDGETSRYSEFDVFFPRGLYSISPVDGDAITQLVNIYAEWRDVNDTNWTRIERQFFDYITFQDQTRDQVGFTVSVDHGSEISPVFRFAKVPRDSDYDKNSSHMVQIRSLRSKLDAPTSYDKVTTIGVKMRGTNAIARTAQDKVNLRGITRKLPTLAEFQAGTWDLSRDVTGTIVNYNVEDATYVHESDIEIIEDFTNGFIHGEFDSTSEYLYIAADKYLISYKLAEAGELAVGRIGRQTKTLVGQIDASSTINAGDISLRNGNRDLYEIYNGNIKQHRFLGDNNLNTAFTVAIWPIDFITPPTGTRAFDINQDADKFWIYDANNDLIKTYSMTVANEIGMGVTNDNVTFDLTPFLGGLFINSLRFQNYVAGEPTMFFVAVGTDVLKFEMSTAGDVSTASLVTTETLGRQGDGIAFPNNTDDILYVFNSRNSFGRLYYADKYALNNYTGDSRSTRSAARFVANQLYSSLSESNSNWADIVDWDSLSDLDTAMTLAGQTLDAEFVDETTLWEAIKIAMSTGNAEPSIKNGKLVAVIDESKAGEDFQHLYTPEVMTDGLQISAPFYDSNEPDSIEAEYFDFATGTNEVVRFPLSGVNPKRIQALGIRDPSNASKFAARAYQKERLKPQIYRFTTEMDALNSEYGDYIGIASSLFSAQTGDVLEYDAVNDIVTLSFEPRFDYVNASETTPLVMFRDPEGKYSGIYGVTQTVNPNQLELSVPLTFTPFTDDDLEDNTQIVFGFGGVGQSFIKGALVREINPIGDTEVEVVAEEYIEEIYDND